MERVGWILDRMEYGTGLSDTEQDGKWDGLDGYWTGLNMGQRTEYGMKDGFDGYWREWIRGRVGWILNRMK